MRRDSRYGSECEDFTADDLHRIRGMVEQAGYRAGVGEPLTGDLVAAVNEIVVNAVTHGGGRGSITVAGAPDGVHVTVQDSGPGLPAHVARQRPGADATGGRGLWLARRFCERLTIASSPRGVTVWLFAPVGNALAYA